jgi:hypothetical protein
MRVGKPQPPFEHPSNVQEKFLILKGIKRHYVVHVRFGSLADIDARLSDVCFTPKSGHRLSTLGCPLSGTPLNNDISSSAGDYSLDLRLLGLRHSELVKRLLQIVEKGFPLCRRYQEMLVRLLH